ncbi:UNVERIFIED_CONTAM: hypothetical protein PYX00_009360 [Menopon gallinae]|uniref:Rieske domain-containing protein n=1 Tax=Menopon gallinae TaxID=328185 RepID=A0AAW2HB95_9NEOP
MGAILSRASSTYVEEIVCREDEIRENQMKVFDLGNEGGRVLLVKQKGQISALGTKCSHYGAPLVNGYLGNGRIRCQWHGACFNIRTGDIEDFPGLDSLPCYRVIVENGNVKVRAERDMLTKSKRVRSFNWPIQYDCRTFIVVGGGPAGNNCVETLRQVGFSGRIIFIGAERYLPYDRVKLSKAFELDPSRIALRSGDFYRERHIEVLLGTKLVGINSCSKVIKLSTGEKYQYDKLFVATGSTPRKHRVKGCSVRNIFVLRNLDDALAIAEQLGPDKNVVIFGASFIAMEVASYCAGKVHSVTVIGKSAVPFKRLFGEIVGRRIMEFFEEKDVMFYMETSVIAFEGENGRLKSVVISDGTVIDADLCIVGIGSSPNTEYFEDGQVDMNSYGYVGVNEYLQTSCPDIYAGGDIAMAPVLGRKMSIGHWGLAHYHGHVAALNMVGQKKPLNAVPFFWTVLFGKSIRYAGHSYNFDDVIIDGDLEELKFVAFYCEGNIVAAIGTMNRDPLAAKFAEMLYEGRCLRKDDIESFLM